MEEVQAKIESMAFKGYGVARIDGQVVFIPQSVTGDRGWIKIIEKRKAYSIGKLITLIEPSPFRVEPPCSLFGQCGGCQWQHIDHSVQINLKKEILTEVLKRLGRLKEIPPLTTAPSTQSYGYRARAQLKVKGETMGFFQERSHRIANIDHCPISHPLINQIISSLQKELPFFPRIEEIEVNVSPEEGKGILILHPLSSHQGMNHLVQDLLKTHPILRGIAVVRGNGFTFFGDPFLSFAISSNRFGERRNLSLRTSPQSFYQVNLEQNHTLIQTVLEFSDVNEDEKVLDLYAGIGNFTLPLAIASKEVWGIEENRWAVQDATLNAERNGVKNCTFIHGRVEDILRYWTKEKPDLVILDPPRMGCKVVFERIIKLQPKKMVYVSCEPTTFSRDLRLFSEAGYAIRRLSLVDMFPQTYHMEVVGLLQQS